MKSSLPLFLLATTMLVSCGGGNTPSSEQSAIPSEESSVAPQSQYLDWVADGKIVIELFDLGDARFTYGNAALDKASNTLDLAASASIACSATFEATQVLNFVYVTETASGTGFNASAAAYVGIEGDKVADFLTDNDDLNGKTRAYVAISLGETVKWTKGKNAAMDAKIQSAVDVSKNN